MTFIHTSEKDRTTARWAGGTTTQLAVFPAGAEFTEFNFIFRMSTATVEVEESTFTFMPGVTRHLMILDGVLEIDHTNRYKKHMRKFGVDVFDGEWPTTAKGKVTDFNLMTIGKAKGQTDSIILLNDEKKEISISEDQDYAGLYILNGTAELSSKYFNIQLQKGDFILVNNTEKESGKLNLHAIAESEIIFSAVTL